MQSIKLSRLMCVHCISGLVTLSALAAAIGQPKTKKDEQGWLQLPCKWPCYAIYSCGPSQITSLGAPTYHKEMWYWSVLPSGNFCRSLPQPPAVIQGGTLVLLYPLPGRDAVTVKACQVLAWGRQVDGFMQFETLARVCDLHTCSLWLTCCLLTWQLVRVASPKTGAHCTLI